MADDQIDPKNKQSFSSSQEPEEVMQAQQEPEVTSGDPGVATENETPSGEPISEQSDKLEKIGESETGEILETKLSQDQTEDTADQSIMETDAATDAIVSVDQIKSDISENQDTDTPISSDLSENSDPDSPAKWYVVHTYSGHENRVATALKQRVESERLDNKIVEVLVPTQDKIEIRSGKKETVKEKIFPGYILVKMILDDDSWLAIRTTQGVTSFVGMGNKPTPISEKEVRSIVTFMTQGAQPTFKAVYNEGDTVRITDGPFAEFIGKVDNVDKEKGKVRVLVSIFGRETPVELDFLQVAKL